MEISDFSIFRKSDFFWRNRFAGLSIQSDRDHMRDIIPLNEGVLWHHHDWTIMPWNLRKSEKNNRNCAKTHDFFDFLSKQLRSTIQKIAWILLPFFPVLQAAPFRTFFSGISRKKDYSQTACSRKSCIFCAELPVLPVPLVTAPAFSEFFKFPPPGSGAGKLKTVRVCSQTYGV